MLRLVTVCRPAKVFYFYSRHPDVSSAIIINTFLYGAFTKLNAPTSAFIANKLEQKCRVE